MKQRKRPLSQNSDTYTEMDKQVWCTLFNRQMNFLKHHASNDYLNALEEIGFDPDEIPNIDQVNSILMKKTGWQLEIVPMIVGQKEFFELLIQKKFPVTIWLREMNELDYLEEPDMFHDVFGHVPLLLNQDYGDFFQDIARIAIEHDMNPTVVKALGSIYWFTIEFGLIQEQDKIKIYGAGICSSIGESHFSLSKEAKHMPFEIRRMIQQDFRTDQIQPIYFITPSFSELKKSLSEIRRTMKECVTEQLFF